MAVIILVSVVIAIAICIALWSSGIVNIFLQMEKLDLLLYTQLGEKPNTFKVTIDVVNIGTHATIINGLYLNDRPFWDADVSRASFYIENATQNLPLTFTLPVGAKVKIELYLYKSYYHGQAVVIRLVTTQGSNFLQTAYLP